MERVSDTNDGAEVTEFLAILFRESLFPGMALFRRHSAVVLGDGSDDLVLGIGESSEAGRLNWLCDPGRRQGDSLFSRQGAKRPRCSF